MLRGKLEKIKASGLDPAWLGGMLLAEGIIGAEDEKAKDEAVGGADYGARKKQQKRRR